MARCGFDADVTNTVLGHLQHTAKNRQGWRFFAARVTRYQWVCRGDDGDYPSVTVVDAGGQDCAFQTFTEFIMASRQDLQTQFSLQSLQRTLLL